MHLFERLGARDNEGNDMYVYRCNKNNRNRAGTVVVLMRSAPKSVFDRKIDTANYHYDDFAVGGIKTLLPSPEQRELLEAAIIKHYRYVYGQIQGDSEFITVEDIQWVL